LRGLREHKAIITMFFLLILAVFIKVWPPVSGSDTGDKAAGSTRVGQLLFVQQAASSPAGEHNVFHKFLQKGIHAYQTLLKKPRFVLETATLPPALASDIFILHNSKLDLFCVLRI